jgi:asparagine synthase (glutamine-hydrolysing)
MNPEKLLSVLRDATKRAVGNEERVAVAYSGGLDSSIVAALSIEITATKCYTCAVRGSHDADVVGALARGQGVDWEPIELRPEGVTARVKQASLALETVDPSRIAYTIPLIGVLEKASERLVLAGTGADELFGGYAKYTESEDPSAQMREDLEKMRREAAMVRMAFSGKRLALPFEDGRVVELASGLPLDAVIGPSGNKLVLRDVARHLGLESHSRPKKAAQYSSGVLKEMRRQAKECGVQLGEWVRNVAVNTQPTP